MIQRSLLLFAASALGLQSFAQPTLTQANNAPVPGDQFGVSTSADTVFSDPGASELYGFWMLEEVSVRGVQFIDPSETSSSNLMTDEDVLSTDGGTDTLFWNTDATGLYLVGERTLATFPYSDPVKELPYPCTFGTNWTDIGSASYVVSPFSVVRSVTVEGSADGYGNLQLPDREVNNVLRVSVRKTISDVSSLATINRVSHITYFYVDTLHYPLLKTSVDSVTFAGGPPTVALSNEWLYGQGILGLDDVSANDVTFVAYPNPAAELITLPVSVNGAARCDVYDAAGRVVLSRQLSTSTTTHQLPVNGMPAGLYTARIIDQDGLRTTRFQVAR